jgi:MFS family permease
MWHLILSQGVAFGLGMGFLFVASVGIPAQWFTKRRSLANGVAAGGSGLGGLIYSLGTLAMIESIGLSWTFRVLAVLVFIVNGVCILLIRDRNAQLRAVHLAFHMDLFKQMEYWLLLSWAFFSLLSYVIVVFSLADYCQTVGFTATQGSIVSAMFNRESRSARRCRTPQLFREENCRLMNSSSHCRDQCLKVLEGQSSA